MDVSGLNIQFNKYSNKYRQNKLTLDEYRTKLFAIYDTLRFMDVTNDYANKYIELMTDVQGMIKATELDKLVRSMKELASDSYVQKVVNECFHREDNAEINRLKIENDALKQTIHEMELKLI